MSIEKEDIKKRGELNNKILKKVKESKEFAGKYVLEHGGTDEEPVPVRRNDWF